MRLTKKQTTLAKHVRALRESRKMTTYDVSQESKTCYHSIRFLENGERPFGISVFVRIIDALDLTVTEIKSLLSVVDPKDCCSDREERAFEALKNLVEKLSENKEKVIDIKQDDKIRERVS